MIFYLAKVLVAPFLSLQPESLDDSSSPPPLRIESLGSLLEIRFYSVTTLPSKPQDGGGACNYDCQAVKYVHSSHSDGHISNHEIRFDFQYVESEEAVADKHNGKVTYEQ